MMDAVDRLYATLRNDGPPSDPQPQLIPQQPVADTADVGWTLGDPPMSKCRICKRKILDGCTICVKCARESVRK